MLHAKTAVADGRLARVGSSNLNIASWLGNYELDAVIEDEGFAAQMADQFEHDLTNATEIVLHADRRMRHIARRGAAQNRRAQAGGRKRGRGSGSAGRGVAGALRIGNTVTAAVTGRRVLATADARAIGVAGAMLVALALVMVLWPLVLAVPFALLSMWFGGALLLRAYRLDKVPAPPKVT
jgi:cardiolipin synthase